MVDVAPTFSKCDRPLAISAPFYLPGREEQNDAHTARVFCIRVLTNFIVTGGADCSVRIWSKETRKLALAPLIGHNGAVVAVEVSERLGIVFSGDSQGTIILWQLGDGKAVQTRQGHGSRITALTVHEDHLVSGSKDQTAKIWKIGIGKYGTRFLGLQYTLQGHQKPVHDVQVHHDRVYTSSGDGSVCIWDLGSGECVKSLKGIASMTRIQLVHGAEGTMLVGACTHGQIKIYRVNSGAESACLEGHSDVVRSAKAVWVRMPEGESMREEQIIVSASYDGTVKIWAQKDDIASAWECVNTLSFSDAVITPFTTFNQHLVDEDVVQVDPKPNKALDLQVDGSSIYCCGEGAEIVVWDFKFQGLRFHESSVV